MKDIISNAATYIQLESQTNCVFPLQFAASACILQIPFTDADSAAAQFYYTHVLLFVPDCANKFAESANLPILEQL